MDTESAHDHHLSETFTRLSGNGGGKEDRIKKDAEAKPSIIFKSVQLRSTTRLTG